MLSWRWGGRRVDVDVDLCRWKGCLVLLLKFLVGPAMFLAAGGLLIPSIDVFGVIAGGT
jgi:hypothetical protein